MTAALAVRERPHIKVTLNNHGEPECTAAQCTVPAKTVVFWLDMPRIEMRAVCLGHHQILRDQADKDGGGALFYPLAAAPPLEVIKTAVEQELARRAPRPAYYQPGPAWGGFTNGGFTYTTRTGFWT